MNEIGGKTSDLKCWENTGDCRAGYNYLLEFSLLLNRHIKSFKLPLRLAVHLDQLVLGCTWICKQLACLYSLWLHSWQPHRNKHALCFMFFRCHLPMLYIGLEYGLTNNSKLAERFFSQALSIAPEDPFVMHEVGVVAFQNGE